MGTVTFLLTDVEPSSWLWEVAPGVAAKAFERCVELTESAVVAHNGVRPEEQGEADRFVAAFGSATEAAAAAVWVQRALAAEEWPDGLAVRVRIGLHTGEAHLRDGHHYTGAALHRCARLRDAAHGGQILVSSVTASILAGGLADGTWLVDRGEHRLRDLSRPERVFELCHPDVADGFPPLRSLDVLPNNLPAQLTSFVGRTAELAEVGQLLAERRLVTLVGAGGCGKTRLALQAAAGLAERWPDGVWWVDLGPLTDPGLVAKTMASTLGLLIEPVGGPLRALQSQLRERRLLVCLDTCEHLVDAAAELADGLLRACPEVSVLATSREPLRVPGEMVWRVPSLLVDDAVQLFADRGTLVGGRFDVEGRDEQVVQSVCRRLDGIPLAIELAAAWARALTPAQIEAGLDDRFALLVGGPRGVIGRHQTLAASVEWSHELLDAIDRVVFRRLAVFAGFFSLDAARAVCVEDPIGEQDVITALSHLVDKSLVVVDEAPGEARYRLLDTIREYAGGRLEAEGETAAIRDRHLDHFRELADRAEPELERDQDRWRQVLEADHDNLRTAVEWGLATEPDHGRRMAAALARWWFLHGHVQEGTALLNQAIQLAPKDRSLVQARLFMGAALVALGSGQPRVAGELAARGLELADANDDDRTRARCLALEAYGAMYSDFPAALDLARQAQRYGEDAGDDYAMDLGLAIEVNLLAIQDRYEEAVPAAQGLFDRTLPRGERFCATFALQPQAYGALFTGDVRQADALAAESVRIAESLGDYFTISHAINNQAWIKSVAGELDIGRKLVEPVADMIEDAGLVDVSFMSLALGRLHLAGGELVDAVAWFERGAQFAEPTTENWIVARALPGLAGALRRLGRHDEARQHADRAVTLARKLGSPHPLAEALEESAFLVAVDDPGRAEDLHHEALAVRIERGLRTFYVDSLDALAGLAARSESFAEAARLGAASETARELMGYPRPAVNQPEHDDLLATVRSALGDDGFTEAWSEGAALSLDDAVGYARRARGARSRPSTGWASLTPAELAVVQLVIEGLSNPEIGARLFVSRATIKTHLTHIYTKLGVTNRTELTRLASTR
ncbi:MAG TPA: LuxR C-terminal-related transcriptional regulator [Acidimicrobiales bacterium]|jgi:predicted ATPase/class 3 adenylate cyclase/DNA-binding CsgD family transcriptional regulator